MTKVTVHTPTMRKKLTGMSESPPRTLLIMRRYTFYTLRYISPACGDAWRSLLATAMGAVCQKVVFDPDISGHVLSENGVSQTTLISDPEKKKK